jgi:hypothetical protein
MSPTQFWRQCFDTLRQKNRAANMLGRKAARLLVRLINGRWRANPVAVISGRGECSESVWVAAQTQVWAALCFQNGTPVYFESSLL